MGVSLDTGIVTRKDTIAETTVLRSYRTPPISAKQYCVGLYARDSPARRAAKTMGERYHRLGRTEFAGSGDVGKRQMAV